MNKDNPACYECKVSRDTLHKWKRNDDGTAYCLWCRLDLTKAQADDVWRE